MTSRDFAYWLQGYFEVAKPVTIPFEETEMIKKHLNLVFKHEIDPSMGDEKHQDELNKIHSGSATNSGGINNGESTYTNRTLPDHNCHFGHDVNHPFYDQKEGVRC